MKKYVVIMPLSWGSGDTLDAADKAARQAGRHGRKKVERVAFCFDPSKTQAHVDNYGFLRWQGESPEELEVDQ